MAYESLVKLVAAQAMAGREAYCPADSAIMVRRAAASRGRGEIGPTVKPDADNIEKAIKDGCNGVAYHDDAQVVQASKRKIYGLVPGVTVVLTLLDMEPAQGVKKNAP